MPGYFVGGTVTLLWCVVRNIHAVTSSAARITGSG